MANIRDAILKAASTLENPKLWDWEKCNVPGCGSPGCAIGWILHHAGYAPGDSFGDFPKISGISEMDFYKRMADIDPSWRHKVPVCLRLYADKYHPAEPEKVFKSGAEIAREIIQTPCKESVSA